MKIVATDRIVIARFPPDVWSLEISASQIDSLASTIEIFGYVEM